MNSYFSELNHLPYDEVLTRLKQEAEAERIPILKEEGLCFLLSMASFMKAHSFLEIGTAIGYTSLFMAKAGLNVTTIERDPRMQDRAQANFTEEGCAINLIKGDALLIDEDLIKDRFDIIFIDAAKAQSRKFFEKYTPFLKEGGIVITDNLDFHGYTSYKDIQNDKTLSKDLRELIRKIMNYIDWLSHNPDWKTEFLPIGDGFAMSWRA